MYTPEPHENTRNAATALKRAPFNQRIGFWVIIFCLCAIISLMLYRHHNNTGNSGKPDAPVVAELVTTGNIPVYISALGSVTPTNSVTVRTQINGQLMRVLFEEGQMVKKGDLLAEIDSRPYEAQLIQGEGQLQRGPRLLPRR